MKKVMWITLAVTLVLAGAFTVWADPPVTKSTGKDAAEMIPAVSMYVDYYNSQDWTTHSAYDNDYQILGASGKVNMIQPNGNVDVILGVGVDGLEPNTRYTVYFDLNGHPGPGPWTQEGEFYTDEYGQGEWNYTAPAESFDPGEYKYAVAVNNLSGYTVLVSHNVEFVIE